MADKNFTIRFIDNDNAELLVDNVGSTTNMNGNDEDDIQTNADPLAPSYSVPDRAVLAVEHPCLVKHFGNAISTLGGAKVISQMLTPGNAKTIGLKFEPNNPSSRPILSFNVPSSNILLKVTVPRRTGRKRKRGSDDPFTDDLDSNSTRGDSSYLIQSLKDQPDQADVEAVGGIQSTHVWRSLPDLVYSTQGSSFLDNVRSHVLSEDYTKVKSWTLPRTYGLTDTEVVPPAVFSTHHLPFNYSYRQNPAVRAVLDPSTGKTTLHNTQSAVKLNTIQVQYDTPDYPSNPAAACPPLKQQPENMQKLIQALELLFDQRPIWTRRALINNLTEDSQVSLARAAIGYMAFAIRSGPWRDTMCKLGIDPRKDPQCRRYQTVMLQLVPRDKDEGDKREEFQRTWNRSRDKTSHIFRAQEKVPQDGKVWQLCDLEDDQLRGLVNIPDLLVRSECETRYFGWYPNGVMAKLRLALRVKIDGIKQGAPLMDEDLDSLMALPDEWSGLPRTGSDLDESDALAGYMPKNAIARDLEWANAYRSICRAVPGALPAWGGAGKGRPNKKKPSARPSYMEDDSPMPDNDDLELEEEDREDIEAELGPEAGEEEENESVAEASD